MLSLRCAARRVTGKRNFSSRPGTRTKNNNNNGNNSGNANNNNTNNSPSNKPNNSYNNEDDTTDSLGNLPSIMESIGESFMKIAPYFGGVEKNSMSGIFHAVGLEFKGSVKTKVGKAVLGLDNLKSEVEKTKNSIEKASKKAMNLAKKAFRQTAKAREEADKAFKRSGEAIKKSSAASSEAIAAVGKAEQALYQAQKLGDYTGRKLKDFQYITFSILIGVFFTEFYSMQKESDLEKETRYLRGEIRKQNKKISQLEAGQKCIEEKTENQLFLKAHNERSRKDLIQELGVCFEYGLKRYKSSWSSWFGQGYELYYVLEAVKKIKEEIEDPANNPRPLTFASLSPETQELVKSSAFGRHLITPDTHILTLVMNYF